MQKVHALSLASVVLCAGGAEAAQLDMHSPAYAWRPTVRPSGGLPIPASILSDRRLSGRERCRRPSLKG
jgi:hypothetical protein